MNLEIVYPELKDMKSNEIFVEWAYLIRTTGVEKLHIKTIIPKKELKAFTKALKLEHNLKVDPEDPNKNEVIELVTIEK